MELIEPSADAVEGGPATDVVDEERTDGATVVGGGDSSEALLASGVPDLGLDLLAIDEQLLRLELDADGRLGVGVELVASEPREQVRLPHRRVADHHDLEQVVLAAAPRLRALLLPLARHFRSLFSFIFFFNCSFLVTFFFRCFRGDAAVCGFLPSAA